MEDADAYLKSGITLLKARFLNFWIRFPSKQRPEGSGAEFKIFSSSYLFKGSTLSVNVCSLVFLVFCILRVDIFINGAIINI